MNYITFVSKKISNKIQKDHPADDLTWADAIVYADGGGNKTAGAWACIVRTDTTEVECCGFEYSVTANRMELMAVYNGLRLIGEGAGRVRVVSDSQYALNACGLWSRKWSGNGWRLTANGKSVANAALLREIWEFRRSMDWKMEWVWVKGHSGHTWNERCDRLCSGEIRIAEALAGAGGPGRAPASRGFRVMASD